MVDLEIIIIEEIGKGLDSRKVNKGQECENCRFTKEQVTELENQVSMLQKENQSLKLAVKKSEKESERMRKELVNAQTISEALVRESEVVISKIVEVEGQLNRLREEDRAMTDEIRRLTRRWKILKKVAMTS